MRENLGNCCNITIFDIPSKQNDKEQANYSSNCEMWNNFDCIYWMCLVTYCEEENNDSQDQLDTHVNKYIHCIRCDERYIKRR